MSDVHPVAVDRQQHGLSSTIWPFGNRPLQVLMLAMPAVHSAIFGIAGSALKLTPLFEKG